MAALGLQEQLLGAVQSTLNPASTQEERKHATDWILQFQKSDEGWGAAICILAAAKHPLDVQLTAAQSLKVKARLCRAQGPQLCQQLQAQLVSLMQTNDMTATVLRQVVLALVAVTLPLLASLPALLGQNMPLPTALLTLETLAEEGHALQAFGPGTLEERTAMVADIKAQLRGHAPSVFSWLNQVAGQQPDLRPLYGLNRQANSSNSNGNGQSNSSLSAVPKAGEAYGLPDQLAGAQLVAKLLACFQAWTRLGSLHEMGLGNCQALVNLSIMHAEQLNSPAFSAAAEVLAEVLDHCPEEWLDALHAPVMRLATHVKEVADAARRDEAEALCKVIAAFCGLRIDIKGPGATPAMSECCQALLKMAALPHVAMEGGDFLDPISWPALQTWTQMAEWLMDIQVGGYDAYDDDEFFGHKDKAQADTGHDEGPEAPGGAALLAGQGARPFITAGQLLQAQNKEAFNAPDEVKPLYENLLYSLLQNLVTWQTVEHEDMCALEGFTPTFTASLNDCLAAICTVLGSYKYLSYVDMLQQQQQQQTNKDPNLEQRLAIAAMYAVSAAGGQRLTSDTEPRKAVTQIMARAAAHAGAPAALLVPFCCAAAATGRICLVTLAQEGGQEAAASFLVAAGTKLLAGLAHWDDRQDVHTPAALGIKALVLGAQDAKLHVPVTLLHALVKALHELGVSDSAAEQALVVSLWLGLHLVGGGLDSQRAAMADCCRALAQPLHTAACTVTRQIQQGGPFALDDLLFGPMRRYALLLQHTSPPAVQGQQQGQQGQQGQTQLHNTEGFAWLAQTFMQDMWPTLSTLVCSTDRVTGQFVQPFCRCVSVLLKAKVPAVLAALQSVLQTLGAMLFRPQGKNAADSLVAALDCCDTAGKVHPLVAQAVVALLSNPRALALAQLGAADKDPEVAEALLKVAAAYVHHTHGQSPAEGVLGAACRAAAAACCSAARGPAVAGLHCFGALLALPPAQQQQQRSAVLQGVGEHAPLMASGLIGSLLAPSPLGRVQKVQAVLIDLTDFALAMEGGNTSLAGQSAAAQRLAGWLRGAAKQFHLADSEVESVAKSWPPALMEALAAKDRGPREHQVACRHIKKLVRELAELHSRTQ